jgi:nucleotide sugar dehydrogenase
MKIAIIGHGFVGRAVDYGFTHPQVEKTIVDPKYGTSINDITINDYDATFICVPTPMSQDGSINSTTLDSVLSFINSSYRARHKLIIIKSTVTPDIIEKHSGSGIVYNPEFLREKTALEDFVNPEFHIFGGNSFDTQLAEQFYNTYSLCKRCPVYHMGVKEASLVKYAINSFLATKVTFFNQLYDAAVDNNINFNQVINAVSADSRIGNSHMRVPGFDNKRGFGGACFPKDIAALLNYTDKMSLLEKVIDTNNAYRSAYIKDERELAQNINYEKTN